MSPVDGRLQTARGQYVYFANPNTQLNFSEAATASMVVDQYSTEVPDELPAKAPVQSPEVKRQIKTQMPASKQVTTKPGLTQRADGTFLYHTTEGKEYWITRNPSADVKTSAGWKVTNPDGSEVTGKVKGGIMSRFRRLSPTTPEPGMVIKDNDSTQGPTPKVDTNIDPARKAWLNELQDGTDLLFKPNFDVNTTAMAGDIEARKVDLDLLRNLARFTPVENRNGKTPEQVFRELTTMGITRVPPGFNPFREC